MNRTTTSAQLRRAVAAAAACCGALLAVAVLAPGANAAFTTGKCLGDPVQGQGASFAASLHQQVFVPTSLPLFCSDVGSTPTVTYNSTGSGSGRRVMGERTSGSPEGNNTDGSIARSLVPRFGMTEEPPGPVGQAEINKGTDAAGDEGQMRLIPASLGAVAVVVNLPNGCSVFQQADGGALTTGQQAKFSDFGNVNRRRIQLSRAELESIYAGEITRWSQIFDWINDGNGTPSEASDTRCQNYPIVRVRRLDDGGTTFVVKDYLAQLNPTRGWLTTWVTPDTRNWPNHTQSVAFDYNNDGDTTDTVPFCAAQYAPFTSDYPDPDGSGPITAGGYCTEDKVPLLQTTPVAAPSGNGNDDLINQVNDRDGSIGYGDLSTARQQRAFGGERSNNATDDTYWVKLQAKNLTDYVDPQNSPNGFVSGGGGEPRGSNCDEAQLRNLPTGNDPTLANWLGVSATDSAPTAYGPCSLTYFIVFDDYAGVYSTAPGYDPAAEERKARTVRDYVETAASNFGQLALGVFDYGKLPPDVQALAIAASQQIGWAKSAGGGGGGGGGGATPPPAGTTTPPTGSTPPPAVPVSNAFTFSKPRSSNGNVLVSVQVPNAGSVRVRATARVRGRTITVASAASSRAAGGTVRLTLRPSAAARAALRRGSLRVSLRITYAPTGGQEAARNASLTLKRTAAPRRK